MLADFALRFRTGQHKAILQIQLGDLRAQFILQRAFADDFASKQFSALSKQGAGANQLGKSFFRDQATDCNDQRRSRGKISSLEFCGVQAIVNTMDTIGALGKTHSQKLRSIVGLGDNYACDIDELIKSNLKM